MKKSKFVGSKIELDVSQDVAGAFNLVHEFLTNEDWEELDDSILNFFEKMNYKYCIEVK